MGYRVGIVADDLSGAADSGLQFARMGWRTAVLLNAVNQAPVSDVVSLDVDSRPMLPHAAGRAVGDGILWLRRAGCDRIFRKIDSTLRGNVGAELDALLESLPGAIAVIAPSFPAAGRTVRNGALLVNGVPVHLTAFANDPLWPSRDPMVSAAIGRQSRQPIGVVSLGVVRDGESKVLARLSELRGMGTRIVVADSETESDLDVLGGVLAKCSDVIGVGSAGLAAALAGALGRGGATVAPLPNAAVSAAPVLVVAGSLNPVTAAQVALLSESPSIDLVTTNVEIIVGDDATARLAETDRAAELISKSLAVGRAAVLRPGSITFAVPQTDAATLSVRLLESLAAIAVLAIDRSDRRVGLLLTGGDTARAVLGAIGASGLSIEREIAPGIPQGRVIGGLRDGMPVVTKAGGFGNRGALELAASVLRRVAN